MTAFGPNKVFPDGVALAVPGRSPSWLLFKSNTALAFSLARSGKRWAGTWAVPDGDVSFARSVCLAQARARAGTHGAIVSVDTDMAFSPSVILDALSIATPNRVVSVPYGKRHGEGEWCLCLPETSDQSVRMHVRGGIRTVDVTRAGFGLVVMSSAAYDHLCEYCERRCGLSPFWYELSNGDEGYACPVADPHYGSDHSDRRVRFDDSYAISERILRSGLLFEAMVDGIGDVVHDGRFRNGDAFESVLRGRPGYLPPRGTP